MAGDPRDRHATDRLELNVSDRLALENRIDGFEQKIDTHIASRAREIAQFERSRMQPLENRQSSIGRWMWVAMSISTVCLMLVLVLIVIVAVLHSRP